MATQFSVQDNKPWKRTFFTIWSGQALSILRQPTGAIRPDLVPDGPDGFSHCAGDRHPGRHAAQRSARPVHRHAGRPLELSPDHADR